LNLWAELNRITNWPNIGPCEHGNELLGSV